MTKEEIIDNIARLNSETWKDREEVRMEIGKLLAELEKALEQQPSDETIKYLECNDIDVQEFIKAMKKQPLQAVQPNSTQLIFEMMNRPPCDDCVSRQAVIEYIKNCGAELGHDCENEAVVEDILNMPPVTPTQRWIPVSERLPASDEDVLVTNGKGMYIGWIDPTDKCWRVDSESEYFMNDIVAWQPLPKAYEEK